MTTPTEREKQMTTETATDKASPEPSTVEAEPGNPEADPPQGSDPGEASGEDNDGTDREAARYRRRLRETEAERDGLTARVEKYRRTDAERVAAETLAAPADLWLFTDVAAVLNEEGDVDPEKVRAVSREATSERPGMGRPGVSFDGGARTSVDSGKSWSQLIGGKG